MGSVLTTISQLIPSQPTQSQPTQSQPTIRPYLTFFDARLSQIIANEFRQEEVSSVSWDPTGARIVSGSWDKIVRVWDANRPGKCLLTLKGHTGAVNSVSFSPDGKRIVSVTNEEIKVWDAKSGQCLVTIKGVICVVSFSPDSKRLVSGSYVYLDRNVRVWDVSSDKSGLVTGQCVLALQSDVLGVKGHKAGVTAVSWDNTGARIVTGGHDYTVRVWDISSSFASASEGSSDEGLVRECVLTIRVNYVLKSVSFSPDGKRILSLTNILTVWDAATGMLEKTLTGHTYSANSVSFSPDGARIVSGSVDKTIKIWDANPESDKYGKCLATLKGHTHEVRSVSFSPNGARIVSGSWDSTVRVWDIILLEWRDLTQDISKLAHNLLSTNLKKRPTDRLTETALTEWARNQILQQANILAKRATDDGFDIDTSINRANKLGFRLLTYEDILKMANMTQPRRGGDSGESKKPRINAVMLRF